MTLVETKRFSASARADFRMPTPWTKSASASSVVPFFNFRLARPKYLAPARRAILRSMLAKASHPFSVRFS